MEDVSRLVARQYEAYPYPKPATDLGESIAEGGYQVGDPSLWARMLWPEGRPREKLSILVAGCGTTQAAWFAYTNRDCAVVGVDLSEASLAHQRYLQDRHELHNLRLFKGDLRDVAEIGRDFDLVVCTGVLHHMADPDEGMRALANVLAPGGVLTGMVYAAMRRTGVYMMQDVFRRLGVRADDAGVAFVRQTLASLPSWHFARWYVQAAHELEHDTAVVDTFLHEQDRAYTVPQVLALVEDNGLSFQGWFENALYYPEGVLWLAPAMHERLAALPAHEQWAATEMLNPVHPWHFFFARKGAPPAISFAGDDWRDLVPQQTPGLRRIGPNQFQRGVIGLSLDPAETALFDRADGARTLREIGDARLLFERLWKQGHVMLSKRGAYASSSTSQ